MDTGELRRQILRALEDARKATTARRQEVDQAAIAYARFLELAVPLFRQAVDVLRAEGQRFAAETPADSVKLVSEHGPDTFLELELERSGVRPTVMGRVSLARGRQGVVVEEQPLGDGKAIGDLTEQDVAHFLVAEIPKLIVK